MNHVGLTMLLGATEIVVQHGFHVKCAVPCRHRKYANVFLNHNLINQLYITAVESIIAFRLAHRNFHAG